MALVHHEQSQPVRDNLCLPCTCKVIQDSKETSPAQGPPTIMGRKPSSVRLVGRICGITSGEMHVDFIIDDGTGCIEGRYWLVGDGSDYEFSKVSDGQYVEFVGRPDIKKGALSLTAFCVRPVTNFNAVTMHFLECCNVYLTIRNEMRITPSNSQMNKQPLDSNKLQGRTACASLTYLTNHDIGDLVHESVSQKITKPTNLLVQGPTTSVHKTFSPIEGSQHGAILLDRGPETNVQEANESADDRIIRIITDGCKSDDNVGVSIDYIASNIGATKESARVTLNKLMDFGVVYSTVDEDHFELTEKSS